MRPDQVERYWREGFVVVEDVFDPDEVRLMREEARVHFPAREEYDALEDRTQAENLVLMPFAGQALNGISFHPRVLDVAEQLLETDEIRLTGAALHWRYAGPEVRDQLLHADFGNNTLLTPREDSGFHKVRVLFYLTDVAIGDGPTYFVSKRHAEGHGVWPNVRTKDPAEQGETTGLDPELYEHEVPVVARAGSAVFFSVATWHRGSVPADPESFRLIFHAAYHVAGNDWMIGPGPSWPERFSPHVDHGRRCIEALTPRQRELLGIPAPGHPLWNEDTIDGFIRRYPHADPEPYRSALTK
jgi:hypothetical protein